MPAYKSSVSIEATPEQVFEFVRDVRNLPQFTAFSAAEPIGEGNVRLTAEVDGHAEVSEAWIRRREGRHPRIEWGSEATKSYHGWLEVDREGEVCSVTVEIHSDAGREAGVDAALDQTLLALKAAVEATL